MGNSIPEGLLFAYCFLATAPCDLPTVGEGMVVPLCCRLPAELTARQSLI